MSASAVLGDSAFKLFRENHATLCTYSAYNSLTLFKEPTFWFDSSKLARREWQIRKNAEDFSIEKSDIIIAPSRYVKRLVYSLGRRKAKEIVVIPPTTMPFPWIPGDVLEERWKSKIVLYMGRLAKEKNVDILITSLKKVFKCAPEAKVVICGEGPERDNLLRICKEQKLRIRFSEPFVNGAIHFIGVVASKKKERIFKRAMINVCLSSFEGSPVIACEALAAALPSIVTNIPPWQERVTNNKEGLLVKINSNDVETGLSSILSNKDLFIKMSNQAYNTYKKNYLPELIARSRISLYKKIGCKI
jgi:glycosyltransferase involved in cell wall biosynthesis